MVCSLYEDSQWFKCVLSVHFILELRNGVIVVVYRDLRWRPRQEVEMPWAWRTRVSGRTSQTRVGRRTSQLEPMPAPAVSPPLTSTTKSPSLRISRYPRGGGGGKGREGGGKGEGGREGGGEGGGGGGGGGGPHFFGQNRHNVDSKN